MIPRRKDVFLVGFNGDPPALELIRNGEMAATIRQDPYGQGQKCVEISTKFMNNETVEYTDPATRSIFFPVKAIDKDNVGQVLAE
jgi:ribose transport system substrate-binding protein